MQYNLPNDSEISIKALYGEKEAIDVATNYTSQHNYKTDIDNAILKYSLDNYTLL